MENDKLVPAEDEESFNGVTVQEVSQDFGSLDFLSSSGLYFLNDALELDTLDNTLVQSFRVGRKYRENPENGRMELAVRGRKKGMFVAVLHPDFNDKVLIGYSLCHKRDKFDYKDNVKMDGLGKWYAYGKAKKYANSDRFVIATDSTARNLPKQVVKIPQSMAKDLAKFISRCRRFYKGKYFPEWTINFALEMIPRLGFEGAENETDSANKEDVG